MNALRLERHQSGANRHCVSNIRPYLNALHYEVSREKKVKARTWSHVDH